MEIDQPAPTDVRQHIPATDAPRTQEVTKPLSSFQQGIERRLGDLSALLETEKGDVQESLHGTLNGIDIQAEQSMYTTVHNWSSHRHSHSHSLPRSQTDIKYRNNPNRGTDSLTHCERDYIYRTEEDNQESNPLTGYDRGYGRRWNEDVETAISNLPIPTPTSSTPCPGTVTSGSTPISYLHNRLSSGKGASPISEGIKRKTVRVSNTQDV